MGMGLEPPFPHFQQPHSEPKVNPTPLSTVFLFFQFFRNPLLQTSLAGFAAQSIQLYFLGDL